MQIINADETRLIDLPGVGPCPRPVDIDQRTTDFRRLKSLRIYRFAAGATIHGESEVDEVFILPLSGRIHLEIEGAHPVTADLSAQGPARALYMTRDHAYRLTPEGAATVAYARADSAGRVPAQALEAEVSEGLAEALSYRFMPLEADGTIALGDGAERLVHVCAGTVAVGDDMVRAGQTVALGPGEALNVRAREATRLLVVGAQIG